MAPGGHNLPRRRPHESLPRNRRQRRRNLAPQTGARPDSRSRHNPPRVRRPMRLELFLLNRIPLASLILNWRGPDWMGLDWISPVVLHLHPLPAASARIYPLSERPPLIIKSSGPPRKGAPRTIHRRSRPPQPPRFLLHLSLLH